MANTRRYLQVLSNSLSAMYSWKHIQIIYYNEENMCSSLGSFNNNNFV
jgi:hypothetical protein